jgi:hypothetical protein
MKTNPKITMMPLEALTPYHRNARTHSEVQVAQIAKSIQEYGWTNPILIDETGNIIAGHGRLMAAKAMGLKEVPTIAVHGLTEAQRRALIIADNKLALNAGWDEELLKLELHALAELDYNLELTGFNGEELSALMFADPEEESEKDDGPVNFTVQFNIVFDDEPQQDRWFQFVRYLKEQYPDTETLGARLATFIEDNSLGTS